jgi:hypothetical protein
MVCAEYNVSLTPLIFDPRKKVQASRKSRNAMNFISRLFGRKNYDEDLRHLAGLIMVGSVVAIKEITLQVETHEPVSPESNLEFFCIGLHYLSRVALHIGGRSVQELVYNGVWDLILENTCKPLCDTYRISQKEARIRIESRLTERELEYSHYSTAYTEDEDKESTLFWEAAKHIADALGLERSNDKLQVIGNKLVMWSASAGFVDVVEAIRAKV